MKGLYSVLLSVWAFCGVQASWYWPFGSSDDEPKPPRLSELMEKASELIDAASDLAAEGKTNEAAEKYREALTELNRVERENPERASTPEFASVRNKRAYVSAAIDSMLLTEAHENARAVAISDTTELEKKFAARREARRNGVTGNVDATATEAAGAPVPKAERQVDRFVSAERARAKETQKAAKKVKEERDAEAKLKGMLEEDSDNRKARLSLVGLYIQKGKTDEAQEALKPLLDANPGDPSALNLKAACEMTAGDQKAAEKTLDRAILSNPRDYNAYYNMASLKLDTGAGKDVARRYYETGRAVGGPKDDELEAALK